jgi:flagellar biosynthesis component FlhA
VINSRKIKISEFLVPLGILSFLLSMLIPLPAVLLDGLLSISIVFSLFLLLSTLSVHNPLMLSSFPTMILIATFYRLALNVSTTRLILTGQESSALIEGLGGMVMQGSLVIGAVVFLIVTLIQFVVIAKGAERVAEVSARFTLDALPGKQMSIDADIRSGLLDVEGARKKRHELQIESRFFGALDGAMKFIKGDAIAGICITIVNICAGVVVGVLVRGLPLGEAVTRFTILTVGDGLLSQIPALLTSLAAAMIVTRVVSRESESATGEMMYQIAQLVIARRILGVICIGLAFVESIPFLPFVFLGAVLLLIPAKKLDDEGTTSAQQGFQPALPPLVELRLSREQLLHFGSIQGVQEALDGIRQGLFERWGLLLSHIDIREGAESGVMSTLFIRGFEHARSLTLLDSKDFQKLILEVLDEHRLSLLDDGMMRTMLNIVEERSPELVSQVVPDRYSLTEITSLCRCLLEEKIPVRNLDSILQAGLECPRNGQLLSFVRRSIGQIVERCTLDNANRISAWQLSPELDILFWPEAGSPAAQLRQAMDLVARELLLEEESYPVIITSSQTRRIFYELCKARGLRVTVLALDEISANSQIEVIGVLGNAATEAEAKQADFQTALREDVQ